MSAVIWAVFAYIAGSIPSAYIITKIFKGIDIRQFGSGNVGATNVFRAAGPWAAAITLVADSMKGYIPVVLCMKFFPDRPMLWLLTAMFAIIGHIWTVFLKFKGGKGVATGLGIFLALMPVPALCAFGVFIIVFSVSKYISLSSITASIFLPALSWFRHEPAVLSIFATITGMLIILKHKSNISRLLNGTENKLSHIKSGEKTNE